MRIIALVFLLLLLSCDSDKNSKSNETKKKSSEDFTYLSTKTYSCGGQTHTVKEYHHNKTGMEFVLIPAGNFMRGGYYYANEKPVHHVTISKAFLMSKCEVTQGVWRKFMGNNPSKFSGNDDLPVKQVSWFDAMEFCEKTGLELPTEAQWEYACRAGTTTEYYWGDEINNDYLWWNKNSDEKTHPVGQKKPNAFGLYDMSGNVYEWCLGYERV